MTEKKIVRAGLMARALGALAAAAALVGILLPATASADFGLRDFDFQFTSNAAGNPSTQAAGHPFAFITTLNFNTVSSPEYGEQPAEPVRDVITELPEGFYGNPTVLPECTEAELRGSGCNSDAQVGVADVVTAVSPDKGFKESRQIEPIFNMVPPAGAPASFAFSVVGITVPHLNARLDSEHGYRLFVDSEGISQLQPIKRVTVAFWGSPASPVHDAERRRVCSERDPVPGAPPNPLTCPPANLKSALTPKPFLTNPSECAAGPFSLGMQVDSWVNPGAWRSYSIVNHVPPGYPVPVSEWGGPQGMTGCNLVHFDPKLSAQPTNVQAESPSGLNVSLDIPQEENPEGIGTGLLKKAIVRLPEGMTVNPSAGEGLDVCTPAQYKAETLSSAPGAGCPNASKLGTVSFTTPLLREEGTGSLFIAKPYDNPFDSLLAMYVVVKIPARGVLVKVAGKVTPDPRTGQLTTTFDDLPQLPFDHFGLSFREGQRSPLSTPRTCGTYTTEAEFISYSAQDPDHPRPNEVVHSDSSFQITKGVGGGACPSGDTPPFHPGLFAGTINNAAGSYSPFDVRLTRGDGEQEMTHFSIKLPPGIIGKLAGVPFCPDAAIEAAKARSGTEEIESPSCPQASEVGRTLVGVGVGGVLTYAPGKVYLAGPYHGSALSIAAITAAKVGPFDVGTVVVREALKVNPETAEVFVDATGSDPIPHIIQGIPVHARDIRVYVDKPDFVLNPTSCERTSTASTVLGSGLDFVSEADDQPVTVTSPFQAADCASLGFKPKLVLSLQGGTKRGAHPKFKAVLTARKGDANIGEAQVTLPHSEFLENAHIKTVCTRVQFAQGQVPGEKCPPGSIYGYAKAVTPLLDEPLQGPVFLRSSSHNLPDLLAALHSGKININLDGHIDSVKGGRIRNTFEEVPDAPVTTFTLTMQGGRKGLLVNSTDLCRRKHRAVVLFTGQNGKPYKFNPPLRAACGAKHKKKKR